MTTKGPQEVQEFLSAGDDVEFILQTCFFYVPPRTRTIYDIDNKPVEIDADEFWWRDCALSDERMQGTQGYLIVWLNDGKVSTHHTYRYPPDI